MFSIICIMLVGVLIGYRFRAVKGLKKIESSIFLTILMLLFIFGLKIGSDQDLIQNLGEFGWQAFVLAASGLAGSLLVLALVSHLFFKKGGQDEK